MRLTVANTFDDFGNLKGSQYFLDGESITESEYMDALKETEFAEDLCEDNNICEECGLSEEECTCEDEINEESECPFCENVHNILEMLDEASDYDEEFEILHSAFSDCAEQCYKQGYIEALRQNAEIMNEIADDMECEDCDCENCNGCEN